MSANQIKLMHTHTLARTKQFLFERFSQRFKLILERAAQKCRETGSKEEDEEEDGEKK
jgi:hypothetical protein